MRRLPTMWKDQFKQPDGHRKCGKTNLSNATVIENVEKPIEATRRSPTMWKDQLNNLNRTLLSKQDVAVYIKCYVLKK